MTLKQIATTSAAVLTLALSGLALAETEADAAAKAAEVIADDTAAAAGAVQGMADATVEDAAAAQAAADATGSPAALDAAEAANVAAEETSAAAAEMMEAKIITKEVEQEAKTDAVLKDNKELIEGN